MVAQPGSLLARFDPGQIRSFVRLGAPAAAVSVELVGVINAAFLNLQVFVTSMATIGFTLAAAVAEGSRTRERLRDLNVTLEGRVLERTEQLVQATQRLEEQAAELTRSNEALDDFAHVTSHDLQEPLRGIAGFAQLLQREFHGREDSKADGYLIRVIDGVHRMRTLIQDLLLYSRVRSQGTPLDSSRLEDVLDDTVALLGAQIAETGATITHDELPSVVGDHSQLVQLLQNLVGNAIKYRSERAPTVHLSAEATEPGWAISVRDNGIGIDPKHHERIFEIFHRLHAEGAYPGTGIGLAICRRILDRHGGRIWVAEGEGTGTTFRFTLPAAAAAAPAG